MRPVDAKFKDTQQFGSGATQGVKANSNPNSGMGYYVWLYGNYQPLGHAGLDIGCPIGTPIYAPADGTVLYAGWVEDLPGNGPIRKWLLYYNFGGIVTVTQHNGWTSIIAHQSNNDHVKAGQQVKEGQLIGLSGNTMTRKTTLAPHVHVEALVDLTYRSTGGLIYGRTDPQKFFGGLTAQGTTNPIQEGFLDMLTEQQQKDIYYTLCTAEGQQVRAQKDADVLLKTTVKMLDGGTPLVAEVLAALNKRVKAIQDATDLLPSLNSDLRGDLANKGKQLAAIAAGTDIPALAKALAEQLPKADAEALVDALATRLGGK